MDGFGFFVDVVSAVWLFLPFILQVGITGFGSQFLDVLFLRPYLCVGGLSEGVVLGNVGQNPRNADNTLPLQVVALNR